MSITTTNLESVNAPRHEKTLLELRAMKLQNERILEHLHVLMRNSPDNLAVGNAFNDLLNAIQLALFEYDKLIDRVIEEYASR